MNKKRSDEMSLRHGLLGLLNDGPMTGYELDKAFKAALYASWHVQTSQVYYELGKMEALGLVSAELVIQTSRPNKKNYYIEEKGREVFKKWLLEDHIQEEVAMKHPFLMQCFFGGENSKLENLQMLKRFKEACINQLEMIKATGNEGKQYREALDRPEKAKYWWYVGKFNLNYYKMCIEWADETIAAIEMNE